jgi:hypothetical protein
MSSLLSKLKRLVSARVRGPRRYRKVPQTSDEASQEPAPAPEVTEAPARQRELPEVTEGRPGKRAAAPRASDSTPDQRASALQESVQGSHGPDEDEALEDDRIVDLLMGDDE